jgi:hypothetical protein
MSEECQNCVNKDKYQDEEPCCDCDPQREAEGFEPLKKCRDYSNFASKKNKE